MSDRPFVRQLSVFIANEAGRVSEVTGLLGDNGINIRGFSVSDTNRLRHPAPSGGQTG